MTLVDSSFLIAFLAGEEDAVAVHERLRASSTMLRIPAPALFEIAQGVLRSRRSRGTRRRLLEGLVVIQLDAEAA